MDGADPIEVELTSHEERSTRRGWRRRAVPTADWSPERPLLTADDDVADDGGADGGDGDAVVESSALATERGRLVTTGVVVGVVALLLGWMLGRAGGGDATTTGDAATTTGPRRTTLPVVGDTVPPPDFEIEDEPAARPVTTRTEGTVRITTVEPQGLTVEPIGIDPRLEGLPIRLVGVEAIGSLVEVDLASATLTDYHVARISADGPSPVIGPDWVVLGGMGSTARIVWSDGAESRANLGDGWQPLHVPGGETFWRFPTSGPGTDTFELSLVDLAGEELGPTVEMPAQTWPQWIDPRTGGVITNAVGRWYVFTPDGVDFLGSGNLVGIGEEVAVLNDCDEQLDCGLYRLDRITGERTPVPTAPGVLDGPQVLGGHYFSTGSGGGISPDGRWVLVGAGGWAEIGVGILELATGRFVELGEASFPPSIAWSPDGRFAFIVENLTVSVYDTVIDETFPVFTDSVRWSRVGVRPRAEKDFSPAEETVEP